MNILIGLVLGASTLLLLFCMVGFGLLVGGVLSRAFAHLYEPTCSSRAQQRELEHLLRQTGDDSDGALFARVVVAVPIPALVLHHKQSAVRQLGDEIRIEAVGGSR